MCEPPIVDLNQTSITVEPMRPTHTDHAHGHQRLLRHRDSSAPLTRRWTPTPLPIEATARAGQRRTSAIIYPTRTER